VHTLREQHASDKASALSAQTKLHFDSMEAAATDKAESQRLYLEERAQRMALHEVKRKRGKAPLPMLLVLMMLLYFIFV
jgi:hypothetical protein